jgi:hypothetical protein
MDEKTSLVDLVKQWANDNIDRTERWCSELQRNDIDCIEDLKSLDRESFNVLLSALIETKQAVLMQKLKQWYTNSVDRAFRGADYSSPQELLIIRHRKSC